MDQSIKETLFTHQKIGSSIYYLSWTIVLVIAIVGFLLILSYSLVKYIKTHHGKSYQPNELSEIRKIKLPQAALISLNAFFVFIISIQIFPKLIAANIYESLSIIIITPFIFAMLIGSLGKVRKFATNPLIHSFSFWKVYLFFFVLLGLRFSLI